MRRIEWNGREYLMTGDTLAEGGAITTPEKYARFIVGDAHLFEDGNIRSYGQVIGTLADIKDLGEAVSVDLTEVGEERAAIALLTGRFPS